MREDHRSRAVMDRPSNDRLETFQTSNRTEHEEFLEGLKAAVKEERVREGTYEKPDESVDCSQPSYLWRRPDNLAERLCSIGVLLRQQEGNDRALEILKEAERQLGEDYVHKQRVPNPLVQPWSDEPSARSIEHPTPKTAQTSDNFCGDPGCLALLQGISEISRRLCIQLEDSEVLLQDLRKVPAVSEAELTSSRKRDEEDNPIPKPNPEAATARKPIPTYQYGNSIMVEKMDEEVTEKGYLPALDKKQPQEDPERSQRRIGPTGKMLGLENGKTDGKAEADPRGGTQVLDLESMTSRSIIAGHRSNETTAHGVRETGRRSVFAEGFEGFPGGHIPIALFASFAGIFGMVLVAKPNERCIDSNEAIFARTLMMFSLLYLGAVEVAFLTRKVPFWRHLVAMPMILLSLTVLTGWIVTCRES